MKAVPVSGYGLFVVSVMMVNFGSFKQLLQQKARLMRDASKLREEKLAHVTEWAGSAPFVRAVLLTSSMTNPDAPLDEFSDLDIELVVNNYDELLEDDAWLSEFGTVLAKVAEGEEAFDGLHSMRMVFYADYVKIDFKIWSEQKFIAELAKSELAEDWDVGYRVLLNKDGLTRNLKAPTYQSVLIKKPSPKEFESVINDFWWDITYVVKCLARNEIFYAKFMSEDNMRTVYLTKLIEWKIGFENNWSVTTNKHGRLFRKFLSPEMWKRIEATFSGSEISDNWRALFAYADLGAELGNSIALANGFNYPTELEKQIRIYMLEIYNRNL